MQQLSSGVDIMLILVYVFYCYLVTVSDSLNPMDCSPPDSSVHGILQAVGYYWSGLPILSPRDLPDPGFETAFPALAGGFFTT